MLNVDYMEWLVYHLSAMQLASFFSTRHLVKEAFSASQYVLLNVVPHACKPVGFSKR